MVVDKTDELKKVAPHSHWMEAGMQLVAEVADNPLKGADKTDLLSSVPA
jgi:hypothetical protein